MDKNLKKVIPILISVPIVLTSCETNSDVFESPDKFKSVKITLKVINPIDDTDEIQFNVSASASDTSGIFKVNDVLQQYNTITLTSSNFKS